VSGQAWAGTTRAPREPQLQHDRRLQFHDREQKKWTRYLCVLEQQTSSIMVRDSHPDGRPIEEKALRRFGNSRNWVHKQRLWGLSSNGMSFEEVKEQACWKWHYPALVLHDEHVAVAVEVTDFKGVQVA
jgi:hypothetical protein